MDSSSCCKLSNQISALLFEWLNQILTMLVVVFYIYFLLFFFFICFAFFFFCSSRSLFAAGLFWNICLLLSYVIWLNNNKNKKKAILFSLYNCKIDKIRQWQFCIFIRFLKWNWKRFIIFLFNVSFSSLIIFISLLLCFSLESYISRCFSCCCFTIVFFFLTQWCTKEIKYSERFRDWVS